MGFIDKVGDSVSQSVNAIIDKNRKYAQLNRLDAVIRNEKEVLEQAYIALGKQYYKVLKGNTANSDVSEICTVIKDAKLRLKKAQKRYNYVEKYGIENVEKEQPDVEVAADDVKSDIDDLEEDEDITIACADTTDEIKAEKP
ncbi:MAG: hypothetical protein PUG48_09390 [Clostridia bacterium]|nr:hypothetical protein [Clostridia bacterium]